jgi:alpha-amylase/alpha-mannosidase (GH57 family)
MHQPFYRENATGRYAMPWVRLHAVKDYLHLAKISADFPEIHQTINVVPSLGRQILEYGAGTAEDRVLELSHKLAVKPEALTLTERREVLDQFFSINWDHFVRPISRYDQLARLREIARDDPELFSPRFFVDAAVWYNLAWIDPTERGRDPLLRALVEKGRDFTGADLEAVLRRHREICAEVIPTYRQLADRGQLELSTSPFYHPILPLLIDTHVARQASPELPLPTARFQFPDDARRQVADAVAFHERVFGEAPRGLWPPEGAISQAAIELLGAFPSISWIASDEHVLGRSIGRLMEHDEFGHSRQPALVYQPFVWAAGPAIFFRDQVLSDRIGFVYQSWNGIDAANDLVERLLHVYHVLAAGPHQSVPPIVSIVLDGENCWESYPNNGEDFLRALFERLSREPGLATVTPSEYLALEPGLRERLQRLPRVVAGSWIASNLETWIGEAEQNRAWECLAATRRAFERWSRHATSPEAQAARTRAWRALELAQGSDWFWWYYSHNRNAATNEFDREFREELAAVYRELDQPVPDWLFRPVHHGAAVRGREMLGAITPMPLTATTEIGFEWAGAAYADLDQTTGAMQQGTRPLRRLYAGYDAQALYLRVETGPGTHVESIGVYLIAREPVTTNGQASGEDRARTTNENSAASVSWWLQPASAAVTSATIWRRDEHVGWTRTDVQPSSAAGERSLELAVGWTDLEIRYGALISLGVALLGADATGPASAPEVALSFTFGAVPGAEPSATTVEGAHRA